MARITSTVNPEISGKMGDWVYVKLNGKTYVRRAPKVNKEARTPAMLLNQQRFREITTFCRQFKETLIPRIWSNAAVNRTGFQYFLKTNAPAFAKDGSISDYRLLKLTVGELPLPMELSVQREAEGSDKILVHWKKDLHFTGTRLKDELMFISCIDGIFSEMIPTGLMRRSNGGEVQLLVEAGKPVYVYLFFASADRWDYSESMCFELPA